MSLEGLENREPTDILLGVVGAIRLYNKYKLGEQDTGFLLSSKGNEFSRTNDIQTFYDNAFYIKSILKGKYFLSSEEISANDQIEYRIFVGEGREEKVDISHTNLGLGIGTRETYFLTDLPQKDPMAFENLQSLQLDLFSSLVAECQNRDVFDPMLGEVKAAVVEAYGKSFADMWWGSLIESD